MHGRHLAIVQTTFQPDAGTTWISSAIAQAALKKELRVSIIAGRDADHLSALESKGARVHRIPRLVKHLSPADEIAALARLRRIFSADMPDIVHTNLAKAGILGRMAARMARVPAIVHTVHGPTFPPSFSRPKRILFKNLERLCARWTDHAIFVGHWVRQLYIDCGAARSERSSVIQPARPAADYARVRQMQERERRSLRRSLSCDPKAFLIVYPGRLVPMKQQNQVVDMLASLRGQGLNAELLLMGAALVREEQGYRNELEARAQRLGLAGAVHFLGHRDDPLEVMAAADVAVLTSRYEGGPRIPVEAAHAGIPFVGYDVGDVRLLVEEDVTGHVLSLDDTEGMTNALAELAVDPGLARAMGRAAAAKVENGFTAEAMVDKVLAIYDRVLDAKAR